MELLSHIYTVEKTKEVRKACSRHRRPGEGNKKMLEACTGRWKVAEKEEAYA